jgi:hypothetical protein
MFRGRHRWAAIACFASWALGPAIGMGLAAHELEHHGSVSREHSHAARAAEAFLHGHLHEDDTDDHAHELTPPSFTPSRLGKGGQFVRAAVSSAGALPRPHGVLRSSGPPPEPTGLAPPDPFGLCVLRL